MSYRNRSIGSYARAGFGFALGFALFSLVAGIVAAMMAGLWLATGRLPPVLRYLVRGFLLTVLAAGLLVLLSDIL